MEDFVDTPGKAKFVTKLDLLKGFWQVPLMARASEISTSVTPDHFLQCTVMAFGMCHASATFQQLINTELAGVAHSNAYLGDLIVYSPSWSAHPNILHGVLTVLLVPHLRVETSNSG